MRAFLVAILTAAAGSLYLAGCTTTPTEEQKPAPTEERKPVEGAATPRGVAPVDVTKGQQLGSSALKDPSSILSKRSIYYDFDRFDVKEEYRPLIEAHAKYLRDNPGAKMLIQGNTDERGAREYNVGLGQRRSDGVKRMMMLLGVKEAQIESVSLGEEKPKSEGHSEEAWAQNRRCDILYNGEY